MYNHTTKMVMFVPDQRKALTINRLFTLAGAIQIDMDQTNSSIILRLRDRTYDACIIDNNPHLERVVTQIRDTISRYVPVIVLVDSDAPEELESAYLKGADLVVPVQTLNNKSQAANVLWVIRSMLQIIGELRTA